MFEKVNPCHPDKVADRIADALVDATCRKEENPRSAVEVLIGHGVCHIIVESSVHIPQDEVDVIVKRIAGNLHMDYMEVPQTNTSLGNRQTESAAAIRHLQGDACDRRTESPLRDRQKCVSHLSV